MKKAICLTLAALTLSAALTGCAGRAGTDDRITGDHGNISTNRDGTITDSNRSKNNGGVFGEDGMIDDITDRM